MLERKYLPQLDGIRALAVMSVLASHFIPEDHLINRLFHFGRAGVVVFFVLSGYLITGILLRYRELDDGGRQTKWRSVGVFYGRRILRIFPIYYLAILTAAILGYAPVRDQLIWHITYLSNMGGVLLGLTFGYAAHLWSVCVEEQFYLLWPMVVIFGSQRVVRLSAVLMIITGMLYKYTGAVLGLNWLATSSILIGCMDSLGLGALIAIQQHRQNESAPARLVYLSAILGPVLLIVLQVIRAAVPIDVRQEPFYQGLIDIALSLSFVPILMMAIQDSPGKLATLLNWRPLRYIGRISYGIYLYHFFLPGVLPLLAAQVGLGLPEPGLGQFLIYSSAAIALASLSWQLIEQPANNLKRHFVLQTAQSPERALS